MFVFLSRSYLLGVVSIKANTGFYQHTPHILYASIMFHVVGNKHRQNTSRQTNDQIKASSDVVEFRGCQYLTDKPV